MAPKIIVVGGGRKLLLKPSIYRTNWELPLMS